MGKNSAIHSHKLTKPIEASRFRLVSSGGTWPVGNVRLAEVIFHGESLGCPHPDVVAKKPRAILFDEDIKDFKVAFVHGHNPGFELKTGDQAYSGGHYVYLDPSRQTEFAPAFRPHFGHSMPLWDFEIRENPGPGQYRYLRFHYKALSPKTKRVILKLGGTHIIDQPKQEWTSVIHSRPLEIRRPEGTEYSGHSVWLRRGAGGL